MAVYLDYNATTPVDQEVQETICQTLKEAWGNPSSSYSEGQKSKSIIEDARCKVADMVGCRSDEIIFTSGGTESNNWVIQTAIKNFYSTRNVSDSDIKPHIITTNIEHDSVKVPLEVLADEGKIDVTFVPVSKVTGAIDVNDIINEIRPNTCLITIMLANNETGVIQPISSIKCQLDHSGYSRKLDKRAQPILFHTDAAQALGKIKVDVHELGVDYLTIVGHKFYGPRVGALYFKHTCPLYPLFYGGGQECGYRPGTENTCMIAGLGKAAELVTKNLQKYQNHMFLMRSYLEKSLKDAFSEIVVFNVKMNVPSLPNTVSVAFNCDNLTGRMLLNEASEICASTGAACHTENNYSNILNASGVSSDLATKTLRLSVGRETNHSDIDKAVNSLQRAIKVICLR